MPFRSKKPRVRQHHGQSIAPVSCAEAASAASAASIVFERRSSDVKLAASAALTAMRSHPSSPTPVAVTQTKLSQAFLTRCRSASPVRSVEHEPLLSTASMPEHTLPRSPSPRQAITFAGKPKIPSLPASPATGTKIMAAPRTRAASTGASIRSLPSVTQSIQPAQSVQSAPAGQASHIIQDRASVDITAQGQILPDSPKAYSSAQDDPASLVDNRQSINFSRPRSPHFLNPSLAPNHGFSRTSWFTGANVTVKRSHHDPLFEMNPPQLSRPSSPLLPCTSQSLQTTHTAQTHRSLSCTSPTTSKRNSTMSQPASPVINAHALQDFMARQARAKARLTPAKATPVGHTPRSTLTSLAVVQPPQPMESQALVSHMSHDHSSQAVSNSSIPQIQSTEPPIQTPITPPNLFTSGPSSIANLQDNREASAGSLSHDTTVRRASPVRSAIKCGGNRSPSILKTVRQNPSSMEDLETSSRPQKPKKTVHIQLQVLPGQTDDKSPFPAPRTTIGGGSSELDPSSTRMHAKSVENPQNNNSPLSSGEQRTEELISCTYEPAQSQDDSSSDESLYEDAEEEVSSYASLDALLEEVKVQDIFRSKTSAQEFLQPKTSSMSVDALALEKRLQEARLNSIAHNRNGTSRATSTFISSVSPKNVHEHAKDLDGFSSPEYHSQSTTRTSVNDGSKNPKSYPSRNASAETTTSLLQPTSGTLKQPNNDYEAAPTLRRTGSADSASSFKRNRASSTRLQGRHKMRQSLRSDSLSDTISIASHARNGSVTRSSSTGPVTSHTIRYSMRNDLPVRPNSSIGLTSRSLDRTHINIEPHSKLKSIKSGRREILSSPGSKDIFHRPFVSRFADSDDEEDLPNTRQPVRLTSLRTNQRRGQNGESNTILTQALDRGDSSHQKSLSEAILADVKSKNSAPIPNAHLAQAHSVPKSDRHPAQAHRAPSPSRPPVQAHSLPTSSRPAQAHRAPSPSRPPAQAHDLPTPSRPAQTHSKSTSDRPAQIRSAPTSGRGPAQPRQNNSLLSRKFVSLPSDQSNWKSLFKRGHSEQHSDLAKLCTPLNPAATTINTPSSSPQSDKLLHRFNEKSSALKAKNDHNLKNISPNQIDLASAYNSQSSPKPINTRDHKSSANGLSTKQFQTKPRFASKLFNGVTMIGSTVNNTREATGHEKSSPPESAPESPPKELLTRLRRVLSTKR